MSHTDPRRYALDALTTTDPAALLQCYREVIRAGAPLAIVADVAEAFAENRLAIKGLLSGACRINPVDTKARVHALCGVLFNKPALRPIFRVSPYADWLWAAWEEILEGMWATEGGTESARLANRPPANAKARHLAYLVAHSDINPFALTLMHLTDPVTLERTSADKIIKNIRVASYFWAGCERIGWVTDHRERRHGAGGQMMSGQEAPSNVAEFAARSWHRLHVPDCPDEAPVYPDRSTNPLTPSPHHIPSISDAQKVAGIEAVTRTAYDAGMWIPSLVGMADQSHGTFTNTSAQSPRHFSDWWLHGLALIDMAFAARLGQDHSTNLSLVSRAFADVLDILPQVTPRIPATRVHIPTMHRALSRIKNPVHNACMYAPHAHPAVLNGPPHSLSESFLAARALGQGWTVYALSPVFYWAGRWSNFKTNPSRPNWPQVITYGLASDGTIAKVDDGVRKVSMEAIMADWDNTEREALRTL